MYLGNHYIVIFMSAKFTLCITVGIHFIYAYSINFTTRYYFCYKN